MMPVILMACPILMVICALGIRLFLSVCVRPILIALSGNSISIVRNMPFGKIVLMLFMVLTVPLIFTVILEAVSEGIKMDCLHPVSAWICGDCIARDGIQSPRLVFSPSQASRWLVTPDNIAAHEISLPCGHCVNCQVAKRKSMATRLAHEASMYSRACMITLTYNEDNIPVTDRLAHDNPLKTVAFGRGSFVGDSGVDTLLVEDVQKFIKRLRRYLEYRPKKVKGVRDNVIGRIRYFACGEYGSKTGRPHYHIIIFGWSPSDVKLLKLHNGRPVYVSGQLEKLWKFGFSSVCDVNTAVAKYAARYVTKKFARLNSPDEVEQYRVPEFTLQSTRHGGIGAPYVDKYYHWFLRSGFTTLRGAHGVYKTSIPRYYVNRVRKIDKEAYIDFRDCRLEWVKTHGMVAYDFDLACRRADCSVLKFAQEVDNEFF